MPGHHHKIKQLYPLGPRICSPHISTRDFPVRVDEWRNCHLFVSRAYFRHLQEICHVKLLYIQYTIHSRLQPVSSVVVLLPVLSSLSSVRGLYYC